ncbi:MAG TPA: aspartate aminotransferase family protein, partial [Marinilabiliaceae bacterium]|nr:aspartate aminotransferase family protein [Marinilabiliaceae bacterium]
GRSDIMTMLAPEGPVYQAGTLSGNPLAMAAGIEMLKILKGNPDIYSELERRAARMEAGLRRRLQESGAKGLINRIGSMMTLFFTDLAQVSSFDEAMRSNTDIYAAYFRNALAAGIYFAPSQFETTFISAAHSDDDIDEAVASFSLPVL